MATNNVSSNNMNSHRLNWCVCVSTTMFYGIRCLFISFKFQCLANNLQAIKLYFDLNLALLLKFSVRNKHTIAFTIFLPYIEQH